MKATPFGPVLQLSTPFNFDDFAEAGLHVPEDSGFGMMPVQEYESRVSNSATALERHRLRFRSCRLSQLASW